METESYFLFGESIVNSYYDDDFENVLEQAKIDGDFTVFKWDDRYSEPEDILDEYDGWGAYAKITKAEYDALIKLLD